MSGEALATPRRGGADKWLPLASFATCTFYVFLLGFLTLWVIVPAAIMRWDPMLVSSGSMSPLIRVGDIVLISDHDGQDLDAGTVITYRDASRDGALVTHRIAQANDDGTYTTKGDANRSVDSAAVHPGEIEGVGRLLVPMVGIPLTWLATNQLTTFLIWAIMSGLAVVVAARNPEDPDEDGAGGDTPAVIPARSGRLRRALRLANLPAILRSSVAAVAHRVGRRVARLVGTTELPSQIRSWVPVVSVAAATAGMQGDPIGTASGVTMLTVVLGLDPKGPELPVGRWWRGLRRAARAGRSAILPRTELAPLPVWRPALASIGIVAVLATSLLPRTEAAFSASTSNVGNTWQAGVWYAPPPATVAVPSCVRKGGDLSIELNWSEVEDPTPDGYVVEWKLDDGPWAALATVPSNTYDLPVTGLQNNVWYWFRIRSELKGNRSAPSSAVAVRIRGQECSYLP